MVDKPPGDEHERVASFLKRFKEMAAFSGLVIYERRGYMETLAWLGITPKQARAIVLGLEPSNYYRSISLEPNERGEELCEFGVEVEGQEVYVKLMIDNATQRAVCVSFHIPRWPLSSSEGGEVR